ncbi:hypothetical protein J7E29_08300 [Streptomyces sp. ISL-90]|nr:hypothetical protein [Streptomyces sp. ISL-90]
MNEPSNERPSARDAATRAMLLDHVRAEPARRARELRMRLIGWSSAGVLALGVAATAGAMLMPPADVSNTELVFCMSAAERNPDGGYPGSGATISSPSGEGRVADATALCTLMWEQGALDDGFEPTAPSTSPGRVPAELQVCVMDDGSAAVVPSPNESVCAALGLAPLAPGD